MDYIIGFKAFNKGLINKYSNKYELNRLYKMDGKIKYGINGNGFHMCLNLEDTLRFFDTFNEEVDVCLVLGFGKYDLYNDEYYGYYDMYSFQKIYIIKKLNREEIINYMKKQSIERIVRFVSLYKMSEEEYNSFRNMDEKIDKYIDYYQCGKKDVFQLKKYSK